MLEEKLQQYMEGILAANEHINLTAITDKDEFELKHYVDSMACIDYPEYKEAKKVIDVGTGAGFPGVPLAVNDEDKEFVLMDSLAKRLKVIDELTQKIGIANVKTIHARAEELANDKEHREAYDLAVSRAVANLATLAEYCLPFVKIGGHFFAYKGPEAKEELDDAKKAIEMLGGRVKEVRSVEMEKYGINHNIVVIEKIKATPAKYPRKAGTPQKQPLK